MGHGTIVGGEVDLLGEAIEDTEEESGKQLRVWKQLISFRGRLLQLKLCMNLDKLHFLSDLDKNIIMSENI